MALRDQPYFPLYVQDYLTDEKLNCCSASSQGVYIKILCILHKQEEYGCILFKQKDKQTSNTCLNFAYKFAKLLPFDSQTINDALEELIDEGVLTIEGDKLFQKRMVRDNKISLARSKAGKKGGGNPNLFKQKDKQKVKQQFKQKDKQNTEYEYEIEYENKDVFIVFLEWLKYKKARREKYKTKESVQSAFNKLVKYSGNNPETAKEIIDESISNNWAGFFEKDKGYKQRQKEVNYMVDQPSYTEKNEMKF